MLLLQLIFFLAYLLSTIDGQVLPKRADISVDEILDQFLSGADIDLDLDMQLDDPTFEDDSSLNRDSPGQMQTDDPMSEIEASADESTLDPETQSSSTAELTELAEELWTKVSKVPGAKIPDGHFSVKMNVLTLDNTDQKQIIFDNNEQGLYYYTGVRSDHGIWVMKWNIFYGQELIEEFRRYIAFRRSTATSERNKYMRARGRLLFSFPRFRNEVVLPFLAREGPEEMTLMQFLRTLQDQKGQVTNTFEVFHRVSAEMIGNSATAEEAAAVMTDNNMIFAAIREALRYFYRRLNVNGRPSLLPSSGEVKRDRVFWSPIEAPFAEPASRRFIATFRYMEESEEWQSLALFGPDIAMFASQSASKNNDPDDTMTDCTVSETALTMVSWEDTTKVPADDDQAVFIEQFWTELPQGQPLGIGIINVPTNPNEASPTKVSTGIFISLFTTKGYMAVWLPGSYFNNNGSRRNGRVVVHWKSLIANKFRDAAGLHLYVIARLHNGKPRQRSFLYAVLQRIQQITAPLFGDQSIKMNLIPYSIIRPTDRGKLILSAQRTDLDGSSDGLVRLGISYNGVVLLSGRIESGAWIVETGANLPELNIADLASKSS